MSKSTLCCMEVLSFLLYGPYDTLTLNTQHFFSLKVLNPGGVSLLMIPSIILRIGTVIIDDASIIILRSSSSTLDSQLLTLDTFDPPPSHSPCYHQHDHVHHHDHVYPAHPPHTTMMGGGEFTITSTPS